MTDPVMAGARARRVGFALCLLCYVGASAGAIGVGARYASTQAESEIKGLAVAVSWVSGASVAALNLSLILGGALTAIVVSAWVMRVPARPDLLFEAPAVVVLATITPLASSVLAWLASVPVDAPQAFDLLVARVLVVSIAGLVATVAYVWWFLQVRVEASPADAALATLAGVATSYGCVALINVLAGMLGLV